MKSLPDSRIVLVEDNAAFAEYTLHVLSTIAGCTVEHFADPRRALEYLEEHRCDAVISDVMLPGIGGLELLSRIETTQPGVPVILVTAYATVDVAVDAVQAGAAGFIRKPFSAEALIDKVHEQIAAARNARPRQRVLAVGAHPDDIEIGAGATLRRHRDAGDDVTFAVMSRGVQGGDAAQRVEEAEKAAELIGANIMVGDLTDTEIPEGHPTVTFLEEAVASTDPTIVYTHSIHDVHQDHRNTHRATLVACRRVPAVYCYQSPSATVEFSPTYFVSVDDHIGAKLQLVAAHASQASVRPYMAPDLIEATARYWGRFAATNYAESFEVVRDRLAPFSEVTNVAA